MPIDANTPEGELFDRLARELFSRQPRIERLDRYVKGDPPLPEGMSNLRDIAQDFFKTSRTNFAELVSEAPRERMRPAGIRTAAVESQDEDGDENAWAMWKGAGLSIIAADVHQAMLSLGDGYVIVSWDNDRQVPVVTAEDPRQVVTLHDPMTGETLAALKLYRDHNAKLDVAYVYKPGIVLVATKPANTIEATATGFNLHDWDWDTEKSQPLPAGFDDVVPVVRFRNRDGVAEFERHIDVLDRINRTVLRGMVIMTYQAFKQRALEGGTDLPERDDQGNLINYDEIMKAGPDALWMLPPNVKVWESGQVDMNPLMGFIKNDVLFLAATTRTPLTMFTPDAATQTAEGASLQREGLVFKTEDRIERASQSWSHVVSLMFRFKGDDVRADPGTISLMWAPVERYSISERANAIAQTKGVVSRYQQLTEIWGMSPAHANQALSELTDDLVLDQQFAQALQSTRGPATSGTVNGGR